MGATAVVIDPEDLKGLPNKSFAERRRVFLEIQNAQIGVLEGIPFVGRFIHGYFRITMWMGSQINATLFAALTWSAATLFGGNSLIAFGALFFLYMATIWWSALFWVWVSIYVAIAIGLLVVLTVDVAMPSRVLPRLVGLPMLLVANFAGAWMLLAALMERGWVFADGEGADAVVLADSFAIWRLPLWQMLDVLPFVKVNDSLAWEQPVFYDQAFVGWIVLFAKLSFVLGVTNVIKSTWDGLVKPVVDAKLAADDDDREGETAAGEADVDAAPLAPVDVPAPPVAGTQAAETQTAESEQATEVDKTES